MRNSIFSHCFEHWVLPATLAAMVLIVGCGGSGKAALGALGTLLPDNDKETVATSSGGDTGPRISDITDQQVFTGVAAIPIIFNISDINDATSTLQLSATSSNIPLLPLTGIQFGGADGTRSVTLTPAAGQTGTSSVTITVSDGTATASDSFVFTASDPDSYPAIADRFGFFHFAGTVTDVDGQMVETSATSATDTTDRHGRNGEALLFDGNDMVEFPDSAELSGGVDAQLTVMCWFRADTMSATIQPLVCKYRDGSWKDWGMAVANSKIYFGAEASANNHNVQNPLYGGTTLIANTWYHGALVISGRTVKVYLNGAEDGVQNLDFDLPDTNATVRVGRHGYYTDWFQGSIDELQFFTRALTATEILSVYQATRP